MDLQVILHLHSSTTWSKNTYSKNDLTLSFNIRNRSGHNENQWSNPSVQAGFYLHICKKKKCIESWRNSQPFWKFFTKNPHNLFLLISLSSGRDCASQCCQFCHFGLLSTLQLVNQPHQLVTRLSQASSSESQCHETNPTFLKQGQPCKKTSLTALVVSPPPPPLPP